MMTLHGDLSLTSGFLFDPEYPGTFHCIRLFVSCEQSKDPLHGGFRLEFN